MEQYRKTLKRRRNALVAVIIALLALMLLFSPGLTGFFYTFTDRQFVFACGFSCGLAFVFLVKIYDIGRALRDDALLGKRMTAEQDERNIHISMMTYRTLYFIMLGLLAVMMIIAVNFSLELMMVIVFVLTISALGKLVLYKYYDRKY